MRTTRETGIVASCLAYLRLRRVPAWRNNTGAARYTNAAGRARLVRYGTPGAADVLGVLPPGGRLLCIECKTKGGRLTEAQQAFLRNVERAGALCLVVTDLSDLQRALDLEGVS
jgi:hypothetical protein